MILDEIYKWIAENWKTILPIFISVIGIIFTALKDFILPWMMKPRITIEGSDDGECVENAKDKQEPSDLVRVGESKNSRWVRIRIRNRKWLSSTAKGVRIKLLTISKEETGKITHYNSSLLKWVIYNNRRNDLAKGEYHLIDLVHEYEDERILKFQIPTPTVLKDEAKQKLGPGIYEFRVGVYGDNFSPIEEKFKIKLTDKFGELNFI